MERRTFVAGLVTMVAAPITCEAQQAGKTARVAVLVPGWPDSQAVDTRNAFRQAFRERGWIEGQNLVLDFRYANNRYERLPDVAKELVALTPDVIFAVASPASQAVIHATSPIPIVFETLGDAASAGLVAELARPGGNVRGNSRPN
jgi:putative tryptophan/tyrosine transport system substrate-binding protein